MSAIETYKRRSANLAARLRAAPTERKMGLALAGATIGNLEKRGTLPMTLMGLPTKPVLAVLAGLVEANSAGMMHKVASAVADATIAAYFYKVGLGGTFIAGENDDDPLGDSTI